MKSFKSYLNEKVKIDIAEAKTSPAKAKAMVASLRKAYGNIDRIDPSSQSYKKLTDFLDKLPKDMLEMLAQADIKWVSMLAKNRLRSMKEEVAANATGSVGVAASDVSNIGPRKKRKSKILTRNYIEVMGKRRKRLP